MFATTYDQIKAHYENTKPIRGRSADIRPAGKRRRDWERIVKTERGYAYQLHGTDCVEFTEDGKLIIRTGGWTTVGTGKFINSYASLVCGKRHNAIWLGIGSHSTTFVTAHDYDSPSQPADAPVNHTYKFLWVPIPAKGEVTFTWDSVRQKYVLDPVKIQVRTVNRKRANEARKRIRPLLDYCKTMLKLSDGEVRREDIYTKYYQDPKDILNISEEQIPDMFYTVLRATRCNRVDWQRGIYKYQIPAVQKTIYGMHDQLSPEVYDYKWIEPSNKFPTNHVGYT